jgi:hypothetical protein
MLAAETANLPALQLRPSINSPAGPVPRTLAEITWGQRCYPTPSGGNGAGQGQGLPGLSERQRTASTQPLVTSGLQPAPQGGPISHQLLTGNALQTSGTSQGPMGRPPLPPAIRLIPHAIRATTAAGTQLLGPAELQMGNYTCSSTVVLSRLPQLHALTPQPAQVRATPQGHLDRHRPPVHRAAAGEPFVTEASPAGHGSRFEDNPENLAWIEHLLEDGNADGFPGIGDSGALQGGVTVQTSSSAGREAAMDFMRVVGAPMPAEAVPALPVRQRAVTTTGQGHVTGGGDAGVSACEVQDRVMAARLQKQQYECYRSVRSLVFSRGGARIAIALC